LAFLKFNMGSNSGQMVEVSGERTILGRHPNCEVVVDNVAVSRHHAQILENHGHFYLEDLRSRNKTFLNGTPIDGRVQLDNGDQIKICDLSFTFYDQPSSDESLAALPQSVDLTALDFSDLSDSQTDGPSETSSIISTLEVSSSSGLRLDVKPEVKLRAVLEISNAVGRVLDQQEVLHKVLDCLFSMFPQADEGFVLLRGVDDNKLSVEATKLRTDREDKTVRVSMTVVKQVMQTMQAVLSGDAMDDKQIPTSASLAEFQIRSMMCVPLIGKSGEPFGVLQLDSKNLRQQFSEDDLEVLVSVASQVTLAVENAKLHAAMLRQRDMQRDMEFASQIQLGFLPNESPRLTGYEFKGYYEAAQDVGGDYFDYVTLSDHRVAVALGDVAGKGVAAALLMARLYATARYHLLTKDSLAQALSSLNEEISSSGVGHRFITFIVAVFDSQTHTVTVVNAGHLPLVCRRADGTIESVDHSQSGLPLGIVSEQTFQEMTLDIEPGDACFLCTDGVTEAMDPNKEIYGRERLHEFLKAPVASAEELVSSVVADVENYSAGRHQADDMCIVAAYRTPLQETDT